MSRSAVACATERDLTTDHAAVRVAIGTATAVATIAVAAGHRADPVVALLLSIAVLSYGVLSVIDVAEQRLPNRITLPLAGATALAVIGGCWDRRSGRTRIRTSCANCSRSSGRKRGSR